MNVKRERLKNKRVYKLWLQHGTNRDCRMWINDEDWFNAHVSYEVKLPPVPKAILNNW